MSTARSSGLLPETRRDFTAAIERIGQFITRRRVALSILVFAALALYDVRNGFHPRDPLNYRDPLGLGGGVLVLCGLGVRSWAAGILHKDTELTTAGPYRSIRNPLYAGSFLMMLGFCLLVADLPALLIVAGVMAMIYSITVHREERFLSRRYPAQWVEYSRATPRFIPWCARIELTANWQLRQWLHHREYQALTAGLTATVLIKLCR